MIRKAMQSSSCFQNTGQLGRVPSLCDMAIISVWIDLSFCDEQVGFQSLLLMSLGELCFCLFVCLNFFKQGQNDAAKIGTGDSGVYQ